MSDLMSLGATKNFSWLLTYLLPFGVLSVAGLAGLILWIFRKDRQKGGGLLILFIAANLIAVVLTFVNDRYRLTSVPFLAVFAGLMVDYIVISLRKPWRLVGVALIVTACSAVVYMPLLIAESPAASAKKTGDYFARTGDNDEAERAYRKAIDLDASYVPAYFYLGALYWRQGRYDEAERLMEEILKREPSHAPALNSLGNALHRRGDTAGAVQYWKKSLDANPRQPAIRAKVEQYGSSDKK